MATGIGKRLRVNCNRWWSNTTPVSAPAAWYASLHTGNPGDDGLTANEVTTTTSGYARQSIGTWTTTAYTSVSNDAACTVANAAQMSFGASAGANAAWGTITYVGVWEHLSTATELVYLGRAAASVSQSVGGAGVTITIATGALTLSLTSS